MRYLRDHSLRLGLFAAAIFVGALVALLATSHSAKAAGLPSASPLLSPVTSAAAPVTHSVTSLAQPVSHPVSTLGGVGGTLHTVGGIAQPVLAPVVAPVLDIAQPITGPVLSAGGVTSSASSASSTASGLGSSSSDPTGVTALASRLNSVDSTPTAPTNQIPGGPAPLPLPVEVGLGVAIGAAASSCGLDRFAWLVAAALTLIACRVLGRSSYLPPSGAVLAAPLPPG